jgi:hypothetical protein
MQNRLLDLLDSGLGNAIGGLLFVIAGVAALTLVALGREYKFYRWFIIGPILYLAMLDKSTWVEIEQPEWKLGNVVYNQKTVKMATKKVNDEETKIKVAWFFKEWNKFSSTLINELIKLIDFENNRLDKYFVKQADIYYDFFMVKLENPAFEKFISLGMDKCINYFTNASVANEKDMTTSGTIPVFYIDDNSDLNLSKIINDDKNVICVKDQKDITLKNALNEEISELTLQNSYITCSSFYQILVKVLEKHAECVVDKIILKNKPYDPNNQNDPNDPNNQKEGDPKWLNDAKKRLNYKFQPGAKTDFSLMYKELAIRLFVGALKKINPHALAATAGPRSTVIDSANQNHIVKPDIVTDIGTVVNFEKWRSIGKLKAWGYSLPYVQGVILWFLAMFFPFFVIAAILPGRHHIFFTWMALWFWVKSWDIGYALIMLLDTILYKIFPMGSNVTDTSDPIRAFQKVLNKDPTFSISMYYDLLGACMMSIPFFTGFIAKNASSVIMDGVNNTLTGFSDSVGTVMRSLRTSHKIQQNIIDFEERRSQFFTDNMHRAFSDPEVLSLFNEAQKATFKTAAERFLGGDTNPILELLVQFNAAERDRIVRTMNAVIGKNLEMLPFMLAMDKSAMRSARENILLGWSQYDYTKAKYPMREMLKPLIESSYHKIGSNTVVGEAMGLTKQMSTFFQNQIHYWTGHPPHTIEAYKYKMNVWHSTGYDWFNSLLNQDMTNNKTTGSNSSPVGIVNESKNKK